MKWLLVNQLDPNFTCCLLCVCLLLCQDPGGNDRLTEVESSHVVKKLKTPKRVNHKGETILHLLAIKVRC